MNVEKEIQSLAAEALAVQIVLAHVLDNLYRNHPKLRDAIRRGFEDAASDAEDIATRLGSSAHSEQTVRASRIIEELRTATLGDHDKPKDAV